MTDEERAFAILEQVSGLPRDDIARLHVQRVTQLLAQVRAETVSAWVPCSERMPEVETRVLIVINGRVAIGSWTPGDDLGPITYWQPLPLPPTRETP